MSSLITTIEAVLVDFPKEEKKMVGMDNMEGVGMGVWTINVGNSSFLATIEATIAHTTFDLLHEQETQWMNIFPISTLLLNNGLKYVQLIEGIYDSKV